MSSSVNYRYLLLGLGFVIIIVLISSFFLPKFYLSVKQNSSTINLSDKRIVPTGIKRLVESGWDVLYQKDGDKSGRTVIYGVDSPNTPVGAGLLYSKDGFPYIVGSVEKWGNIEGSSDMLLYLKNPINNNQIDTVRVVVSPGVSLITNQKVTYIGVENLNKVISGLVRQSTEDIEGLEKDDTIDIVKLKKLVDEGDVLVIYPVAKFNGDKWSINKDKDGHMIASTLLLRRYNGIKDL